MARKGRSRGIWLTPEVEDRINVIRQSFPRESEAKILECCLAKGAMSPDIADFIQEYVSQHVDERKIAAMKNKISMLTPAEMAALLEQIQKENERA